MNAALQRRAVAVKPFLFPLVSGALLALGLPRIGLSIAAWFALAPLLWSIRKGTVWQAFSKGTAAGFAYHGLALYWIYSTCRFALIPVPICVLAWFALAVFMGLAWGAAAAFGRWAAQPLAPRFRPWAWAAAWTAVFVVLERWTPRVCTDLLAYTQWRHLSLVQSAALFGPHGLGFLIVATNASWLELDPRRAGAAFNAALCATTALVLAAAGVVQLAPRPGAIFRPTARVEILQPNVDQYQKWDDQFEERISANFQELLARPRGAAPALIVWPESSLPRWLDAGGEIPEASPWSRKLKAVQIVGALTQGPAGRHNAAVLLGSDGKPSASYAKRVLVPFGEYVPFDWAKSLVGILNQMSGLDAGAPVQPLLETPLGPAAASVCYEAMFPSLIRADAARGARLIVNVTNDGWYKGTWGPYQHFYANVFRAVENRATVLRSGNTGISAVIDPWGRVVASLALNARGRLDVDVPIDEPFPGRSLYTRTGDWFGLLCLGLAAALGAGAARRAQR